MNDENDAHEMTFNINTVRHARRNEKREQVVCRRHTLGPSPCPRTNAMRHGARAHPRQHPACHQLRVRSRSCGLIEISMPEQHQQAIDVAHDIGDLLDTLASSQAPYLLMHCVKLPHFLVIFSGVPF